MLFSFAKKNLIANFKARFSPNPEESGYLFYPKKYEQGYACSETDYLKYTSDFQKSLKVMTRLTWFWFLVAMPLIIVLIVWQGYDLSEIELFSIVIIPLPFLIIKGINAYNAPNVLANRTRPAARPRSQEEIDTSIMKSTSWSRLIFMTLVPLPVSYFFLKNTTLQDWQIALGICGLMAVSAFGLILMFRKWRLRPEKKAS